ncbi:MAG TPA: DsrE family protein [Tepidisphaeraceae bacterium]|nr:DsrE family protein [Tepidisphaeraceae bacterium]
MKHVLAILAGLAVLTAGFRGVQSQATESDTAKRYRVVWQVTAKTPEQWEAMQLNIENFRESVGAANSEVTVIAHGNGIGLVQTSNAAQAERIQKLMTQGVKFMACENTLKRKKISKEEIMPGVGFVDSGVAEVVRLQTDGWAYIKAGE